MQSETVPSLTAGIELQYKQNSHKEQKATIELETDCIGMAVHEGERKLKVSYRNMLSVAKDSKHADEFKLIVFVNDGNGQEEEYFEDEEEEDEAQNESQELRILKELQSSQKITTPIEIIGCFTITIVISTRPPPTSPQVNQTQLQRQVAIQDYRNGVLLQCEQFYEGIVHKLNSMEEGKNQSNGHNNYGICRLMMGEGEEGGQGEEWEDCGEEQMEENEKKD